MADSTLDVVDPRLRSPTPGGTSLTLRNVEEPDPGDGSSDEAEKEGDDGSVGPGTKRRKLNLWKCKQCREARKKVRIIMALRSSGGNARKGKTRLTKLDIYKVPPREPRLASKVPAMSSAPPRRAGML